MEICTGLFCALLQCVQFYVHAFETFSTAPLLEIQTQICCSSNQYRRTFSVLSVFFPLEAYRPKLCKSRLVATFSPSRIWKCYHLDASVSCNLLSASYQILQTSLINEFVLLVISWCCWPSLLSRSAKFSQTSFQISFTVSPRGSSHEIAALNRIWNRICFLKLSGDCGTWNMSVLPS